MLLKALVLNKLNLVSSFIRPHEEAKPEPKNVLVIQSHPVNDSFSTGICERVIKGLQSSGNQVRVRKLYFQGDKSECYGGKTFQPVLTAAEKANYLVGNEIIIDLNNPNTVSHISSDEIKEAVMDLKW